jgi:hypothetical protein
MHIYLPGPIPYGREEFKVLARSLVSFYGSFNGTINIERRPERLKHDSSALPAPSTHEDFKFFPRLFPRTKQWPLLRFCIQMRQLSAVAPAT